MSKQDIWLNLSQQIFQCHDCGDKFLATSPLVNKNAYISNNIKYDIAFYLMDTKTETQIAIDHNVSVNTVSRVMDNHNVKPATNFSRLPRALMFDEVNLNNGRKLLFIAADAKTHKPLTIEPFRNQTQLRSFFLMFNRQVRKRVRTIVVDMNNPYFTLIKELFPNARIIIDRFHIVTQAYCEFNKVRISVMKQFGSDSKEYRQLKRFWTLLMKHETALDYTTRKSRVNFKHAYLTDKEVIDRLLALSDELRDAYAFYQGILYAIETHDEAELKSVLYPTKNDAQYRSLPKAMKKARRTIRKHFDEIINSFIYGFSNGPIEGSNNKIKAIKRTAYGFCSFKNFRLRILISFKNSFYSMNYKQKAADLDNVKSAA